jgi:hypothetical protein
MEYVYFLCGVIFVTLCMGVWAGIQLYKESKS